MSNSIDDTEKALKQAIWLHKNNKEITAHLEIWTSDIIEKLEAQGIDPTPANIAKVAQKLRHLAMAHAQAWLQDEKDWKSWIEDK